MGESCLQKLSISIRASLPDEATKISTLNFLAFVSYGNRVQQVDFLQLTLSSVSFSG